MTRRATEFDRLAAAPPSRTTTADEWLRVPELDAADVVAEAGSDRPPRRAARTAQAPHRQDQPAAAVVVGALVWAGDGTFAVEQRIGDVDIEVRR